MEWLSFGTDPFSAWYDSFMIKIPFKILLTFFLSEGCFSTLSSYAHKIRIIFAFEDTLILSLCMEHALSQTLAYFSSQISGVRHWHDKLSFLSHVFSSEVSGKLTLHGHFITGKENFSIHSSKFTNLFKADRPTFQYPDLCNQNKLIGKE